MPNIAALPRTVTPDPFPPTRGMSATGCDMRQAVVAPAGAGDEAPL